MEKSESYKRAEATLPNSLHKEFEMLVEDYRGVALIYTQKPFVNYNILAALIDAGWRRTTPSPQSALRATDPRDEFS